MGAWSWFRSAGGERLAWFGAGMAASAALFLLFQVFAGSGGGVRVGVPPRPTPAPAAVHVAGDVRQPGVYRLPATARVEQAIELAGGATDSGDPSQLNLAARVVDGQRITVPRRRDGQAEAPVVGTAGPIDARGAATGLATGRVSLNSASFAELDALPGVGPATAQKIIDQRQKSPFTSVEQLLELKLVNSATFARIRDLVVAD